MASLEEIRNERVRKLNVLKERGIDPYPVHARQDMAIAEAAGRFSMLSKRKKALVLGGRIVALRGQGALVFADISDGTERMQLLIKKGKTKEDDRTLFGQTVDIGDIIEAKGRLCLTKRREKTLEVKEWRMLAKSLRPLPDKWHGLQDVEERFRRRYLDTLMSASVKERFVLRSKMVAELRAMLDNAGYLEVETPVLQTVPGGANAEPFATHHNALDIDLLLRIAPELYLKKLMVGGFPRVYEIGRNFRNEGIDATHNPEFTMLEFYESYSDAQKQMAFVEKTLRSLVKKLFRRTTITYDDRKINFSKPFKTISFFELLKRHALIVDPERAPRTELALTARQLGVEVHDADSREQIMDNIYKKTCRPKIMDPTFVINYPVNFLPLAKRLPEQPAMVDAFQLVAGGLELVKAFSELNDPLDQKARFDQQEEERRAGNKEAQKNDKTFLEALEYGMPPLGGVGLGVDRLAMLFTDTKNIREVILFPTMRPMRDGGS